MSSLIQNAFNFSPVNSGNIVNGSYTVPAGKYSRVIVNLSARAQGTGGKDLYAYSIKCNSISVEYWLKSGDVVTTYQNTQVIAPSGLPENNMELFYYTALSTVSINSTVVARCPASFSFMYLSPFVDVPFIYLDAAVNYRYEEYNNN